MFGFVKKYYGFFLILLLSFWVVKPFFAPGFFPMHDNTQVARVFEMGKMLKMGVFPVRWVPDLGYGYGYPIFNFYAPLAYYIGGAFTLFGFDALLATKIMMGLGIILSGVFMYFFAKEFFGELGGAVSGLFYLYAPYHAIDIYVRGDVAEFWAYALIPLMFLGIYKKNILIGAIGYAGVILSHNLTAMMVTPFLFAAILLNCCIAYRKNKLFIIHNSLFIILLGLVLSAFYWLPAILEFNNTNVLSQIGGGADFKDHFVCLPQLWSSPWGFGGSAKGCIDGLSFMIGKLHLLLVFASIFLVLIAKRFKPDHYNNTYHYSGRVIAIFSILGFFVSTFLTLELSKPIWEAISTMTFLQYPWRFLILVSFFSSFLAGFAVLFFQRRSIQVGILLVGLILLFNSKFFVPQTIFLTTVADFTNEQTLKWTASKISDEYLPVNFKKPKSEKEVWKTPLTFKETSLEKASNLISLVGALVLITGIIFKYAKTKR